MSSAGKEIWVMQYLERLSRLEGAYEQVGDRLNGIDVHLSTIDSRFDALDRKVGALYGFLFTQTAVILGAIAGVAFALHR